MSAAQPDPVRQDQGHRLRLARARSSFVCVVSGKGGVGKTNFVTNLGVAAAGLGARTLLVDGDLGLSNIDVLLGLAPRRNLSDVLSGSCRFDQALSVGPRGIHILPADSAGDGLVSHGRNAANRLLALLDEAALDYDLVLIDAGAGIGPVVTGLASACPHVLVMMNPEPTSLADAYATCKVLWRESPQLEIEAVVNGAISMKEGRAAHTRLENVVQRFLNRSIALRAILTADPRIPYAVSRQRAVVELYPTAVWSRRLVSLAREVLREKGEIPAMSGGNFDGRTQ